MRKIQKQPNPVQDFNKVLDFAYGSEEDVDSMSEEEIDRELEFYEIDELKSMSEIQLDLHGRIKGMENKGDICHETVFSDGNNASL